jgi:hypothetical protein
MAAFDHRNLSRQEAEILRRLAEALLHEFELSPIDLNEPPEPGQRERPFVRRVQQTKTLKSAISKLKRIETK